MRDPAYMKIDDPKVVSAALRRLADALDEGKARVIEIDVHNDTDIVELPTEPHEHQQLDVVFRGQRFHIRAISMRDLLEAEAVQ